MSIITLITDFGTKDHYVGALKGKILSQIPVATIVDITHTIEPFNIFEAYYVLQASYKNFPENSIHIIGVGAELNPLQSLLVAYWNSQYFVCIDNGILSLLFENNTPDTLVSVQKKTDEDTETNLFVAVSKQILLSKNILELGEPVHKIKPISQIRWENNNPENELVGKIVYIDHYGNCITDIQKNIFENIQKNRSFEIYCKNKSINHLNINYSGFKNNIAEDDKANEGRLLAHFNDENFLEFAIYKGTKNNGGTAKTLLGLQFLDKITIKFINNSTLRN